MPTNRTRVIAPLMVALATVGIAPAAAKAAGWLPPQTLRSSTVDGSGSVDTATAPDGTTIVAFSAVEGGVRRAVAASRRPGEAFGALKAVSPAASAIGGAVDVAIDRQGNAALTWVRGGQVEVASRPAGQDWGAPQALTAPGTVPSSPALSAAAVAVGDNGAAVVAWVAKNAGAGQRVSAAFRPAGTSSFVDVGPVSDAGAATDLIQNVPAVAMDAAGDYAVAWRRTFDYDGGGATYGTSTYSEMRVKPVNAPAGAIRHLSPYPTTTSTTFRTPSLAMSPAGRLLVTWDRYSSSPGATYVEATEYVPGGAGFASGTYTTTVQPYTRTGGSYLDPHAVLDPSGGAAILFYDFAVQVVSRSSAVAGFSPARTLSGPGADPFYAVIGQAASGDSFVTWPVTSGGRRIYVSARRPAGKEGFEDPVEAASLPLPSDQYVSSDGLSVGGDDEGNAVLAYVPQLSSSADLNLKSAATYVSGFDAGPPTLSITAPAAGTVGAALSFEAATADRMSPVSVAWNFGDGGTATGSSPAHAFAAPGTFTVTATATDAAGNKAEGTRVVQVAAAPPAPTPPAPAPGLVVPAPTTTPAPVAIAIPLVGAKAVLSATALKNGKTRVTRLRITQLQRGDKVKLSCKGTGCAKKANRTTTFARKKGNELSLDAAVAGLRLSAKATLRIEVTRTGASARIITFTMVRRKAPTKTQGCLDPGAAKQRTC